MNIERFMTRNPVIGTTKMSIPDASALMKREKVQRLPILDENEHLVGMLSEKDILNAAPASINPLSLQEVAFMISRLSVSKLMKKEVMSVGKETTVEEASRLMVDQDISCLPVLENEKLIGVLTTSDLFKVLLELFGVRHYGIRISFLVEDKVGTIARISEKLAKENIDIITLGTFSGTDTSNAILSLKVQGATKEKLVEVIQPLVSEILDIQEV